MGALLGRYGMRVINHMIFDSFRAKLSLALRGHTCDRSCDMVCLMWWCDTALGEAIFPQCNWLLCASWRCVCSMSLLESLFIEVIFTRTLKWSKSDMRWTCAPFAVRMKREHVKRGPYKFFACDGLKQGDTFDLPSEVWVHSTSSFFHISESHKRLYIRSSFFYGVGVGHGTDFLVLGSSPPNYGTIPVNHPS